MPLATATPQPLIGPLRSWWVPRAISVSVMPWFVTLVCAPAEPAASASAAPINAARQWSSLMVFPRVRCRRGAGGAGTSILELCCPSGGADPSAAGGRRTEDGEGLTEGL